MRSSRPTRAATRLVAGLAATPLLLGVAALPASAGAEPLRQLDAKAAASAKKDRDTLRYYAPKDLRIGSAAAGGGHHVDQPYPDPFTFDQGYRRVLGAEFSSVSPENQMKWEFIHPERGTYRFGPADAIVDFARQNGQVVRGHTLFWHSQNPAWLQEGNFTKRQLRRILKDHVTTVVSHFKGRISQWDVANEIVTLDASGKAVLRDGNVPAADQNIWIRELGPGIIADVFRWAHQADPKAKLFFNDYGNESIGAKSDFYLQLIKDLKAQGVPVHGYAVQAHLSTRYGFPGDLQQNLQRFDDLGLQTAVTEIDVRMDVPQGQQPTAEQEAQQADYYRSALEACLAVEDCTNFTVWGVTDKYSWVPVFFANQGYATIMTQDFMRKPAYFELREALAAASGKKVRV